MQAIAFNFKCFIFDYHIDICLLLITFSSYRFLDCSIINEIVIYYLHYNRVEATI